MILGALLLASLAAPQASRPGDSLIVTLLGTGTPQPRTDRMGPATLVEAGAHRLLFDAGRGVTIRLEEVGLRPGLIPVVFLTHHHSDHTSGLPDLWLTGWLPPFGGRSTSLLVIGPRGTEGLVRGLTAAFAEDVRIRAAEEGLPPAGARLMAREFVLDTVVFQDGDLTVESFAVDHGGELRPAYGYRVTYRGRSVVLSGDTRYSTNLLARARGADVLVHEVAMAPAAIRDQPSIRFILGHHTSPEEVARVFTQTMPRLAVLSHYALPPSRRAGVELTPDSVLAVVQRGYGGRVVAGRDLLRIVVGDSIVVTRAGPR